MSTYQEAPISYQVSPEVFEKFGREMVEMFAKSLTESVVSRSKDLAGCTAESLTTDIPDERLRAAVNDSLKTIKLNANIGRLQRLGALNEAEAEELRNFVVDLNRRAAGVRYRH